MSCAGPRAGWSLRGKKLSPKIYLEGTQTELKIGILSGRNIQFGAVCPMIGRRCFSSLKHQKVSLPQASYTMRLSIIVLTLPQMIKRRRNSLL
jgi:hypothetical protein